MGKNRPAETSQHRRCDQRESRSEDNVEIRPRGRWALADLDINIFIRRRGVLDREFQQWRQPTTQTLRQRLIPSRDSTIQIRSRLAPRGAQLLAQLVQRDDGHGRVLPPAHHHPLQSGMAILAERVLLRAEQHPLQHRADPVTAALHALPADLDRHGARPEHGVVRLHLPHGLRHAGRVVDLPVLSALGLLERVGRVAGVDGRRGHRRGRDGVAAVPAHEREREAGARAHHGRAAAAHRRHDHRVRHGRRGRRPAARPGPRARHNPRVLRAVGPRHAAGHDRAGHVLPAAGAAQATAARGRRLVLPAAGPARHGRLHHHVPGQSVAHRVPPGRALHRPAARG